MRYCVYMRKSILLLIVASVFAVTGCDFFRSLAGRPTSEDIQAKKIEIDTWPETRIEIDGEAVGTSPFVFELVPQCIRVVVGPNYKIS